MVAATAIAILRDIDFSNYSAARPGPSIPPTKTRKMAGFDKFLTARLNQTLSTPVFGTGSAAEAEEMFETK
jgi:hypothetical protein